MPRGKQVPTCECGSALDNDGNCTTPKLHAQIMHGREGRARTEEANQRRIRDSIRANRPGSRWKQYEADPDEDDIYGPEDFPEQTDGTLSRFRRWLSS
jgi:hypothetical protein